MYRLVNLVKKNYLLTLILIFSLGLKLYYANFLVSWSHDTSRDLVKIYKLFKYHEIIWNGPVFSVVWGFLSPVYYYILAPVYWVFNYHPIVPGASTLFLNFVTLLFLTFFASRYFNKKTGILIALFYGLSFVVNKEGAYGLNPNFISPFTVLLLYSLFRLLLDKEAFFVLLVSISVSFMLSFHPSGFFVLSSLVGIYLFFRPSIKLKYWVYSLFSFGVLTVLPYALMEKKFNFWNTRQIYNYINKGSATASEKISFVKSVVNFLYVLVKNISLVLFGSWQLPYVLITSLIFLVLVFWSIKMLKKDKKIKILSVFLIFYIVPFALLIKFKPTSFLAWWFHPVFIPVFLLLLSYFFAKLKTPILLLFAGIFVFYNLYSFINYIPKLDTYEISKQVVEFIRNDSQGKDFDIYGSDERPINYMMWYFEKDPALKEKYFKWVKWDKNKNSGLVYYLENYKGGMKFKDNKSRLLEKHRLKESFLVHSVGNSVLIYKLF